MCCNKNYQDKLGEKLKERFFNTHKFSNHNSNKFILLLRTGVYPYEHMDYSENFNETSLTEIEDFYDHLNTEDITDADYAHAKRIFKEFEIKDLEEYHDLYVQSDTLLLFMYLRPLEICVLKYKNLILQYFFQLLDLHGKQL